MIFPSNQPWDAASNLRAWLVAPELRKLGWRAVVVPEPLTLRQRQRLVRLEKPDVIVLQQTRHPLNVPALYAPIPCVVDADDADCLDPKLKDHIARCTREAHAVIGGSRFVAQTLSQHSRHRAHVIWTCTPRRDTALGPPPANRPPVVAWAHNDPLMYPQEAALVRRIMLGVAKRTQVEFWLFGTRESEAAEWLQPIRQAGARCVAVPRLPYAAYLDKVSEAAVGLQPICLENEFSRGKSFGKVLAYLQGQVAVVASRAVDHPLFFRHGENGYLADSDVESWVDPIVTLLEQPELRARVARSGWQDFQARLTTEVFARLLDPILRSAARVTATETDLPHLPL